MYDMRQEPNEFVADSLAEARAKAADFFRTEESNLKVAVAPPGEIYGSGGRAVIVAVPKGTSLRDDSRGDRGDRGADRGEADRGRGRESGRERDGGRGRDRDRGGRGRGREREARGEREERPERAPREESRERGGRVGRGDRGRETAAVREVLSEKPREAVAVKDSRGKATGKLGPVGEFLQGAIERMKLGSFEISESSEGDFLIYQLTGPAAEALQSGDGRATDALQLIANQVAMRQSDDAPRIVVDVEGGGDEREDTLSRLADRAVKRARETGRSIALDPMNSRDRRAIHLAVRDEDDVATMSIGEGRYRQVLVVPEGAPEYDDAVAESSR